jgi:hypothetical protein
MLAFKDMPDQAVTHLIHFRDEVRVDPNWTAMIVHAIYAAVMILSLANANEHMNVMSAALQAGSELGDVVGYSPNRH